MPSKNRPSAGKPADESKTVTVEFDDGIAWVIPNRPEKRNSMNPALNREMWDILDGLELDPRCGVVVLTGAGDSFTAGMDLKEFFREHDELPPIANARTKRRATDWMWAS